MRTGRSIETAPVARNAVSTGEISTIGAGRTALVIDSDNVSRTSGVSALEQLGFHVLAGASSTEARSLAFEHGGEIDVVVYDTESGGLSAEATVALLGQVSPAKVLVTGKPDTAEGVARRYTRIGNVAGFLPKPYSAGQLHRAIAASLDGGVPKKPPCRPFGIAHIS